VVARTSARCQGAQRATHPGIDGIAGNADDIIGSPGVPQHDSTGAYIVGALLRHSRASDHPQVAAPP
jgi:hypothetical protein